MGYPIQGADVTKTNTSNSINDGGQTHAVGSVHASQDGKEYIFCHANGAFSQYDAGVVDEAGEFTPLSATTGAADGVSVAVAQVAFADNAYGWALVKGAGSVNVAASCAANVPLYATATAGTLDDAATVNEVVGIRTTAADGGSGGSVTCYMDHPHVLVGTFA